jgi:hypothetical protein
VYTVHRTKIGNKDIKLTNELVKIMFCESKSLGSWFKKKQIKCSVFLVKIFKTLNKYELYTLVIQTKISPALDNKFVFGWTLFFFLKVVFRLIKITIKLTSYAESKKKNE